MPTFQYEAMTATGQEVKADIEATTADDAIAIIRTKGYFPTKVRQLPSPTASSAHFETESGPGKSVPGEGQRPRGLREVAMLQRIILLCILGYLGLFIGRFFIPSESNGLVMARMAAWTTVFVTSTVFLFLLATKMYGKGVGILLGFLTLIPFVGLIILLLVSWKATKLLKQNGSAVGLLGAKGPIGSEVPQDVLNRPGGDQSLNLKNALVIIDRNVEVPNYGMVIAKSAGSDGELMKAAQLLREEHQRRLDNPLIWYAYASALRLAMQSESALVEMQALAKSHSGFNLAQYAIRGWVEWKSHFGLPPWSAGIESLHPALVRAVKASVLLPTRDGIEPRATFYFRDTGGDINPRAVQNVRIALTTVISPVVPQVVGIYASVFDNPDNPMNLEALGCPFVPRGETLRSAYEYLACQHDLDFVIIDTNSRIVCNRRLKLSENMLAANKRLGEQLEATDGTSLSPGEMNALMRQHVQRFSDDDVVF